MARALALATAAAALVLGGCAVDAEQQARRTPDGDVPFGLLDPLAAPVVPTTANPARAVTEVCYLDDGLLVPVHQPVDDAGPAAALDALASPPTFGGRQLDTAAPASGAVIGVDVSGGVAVVRLSADFDQQVVGEDRRALVAQVVCTLTGQPGIGQVAFSLAGRPVQVPAGNGTLSTGPVSREDYDELFVTSR